MKTYKIQHAAITKTVTVRLITVESYQKLLELGFKVVFVNSEKRKAV